MLNSLIVATRSIRRPWLLAAMLASMICAAGGTSARAQYVLYEDYHLIEVMSTYGQPVFAGGSAPFVPWTGNLAVYFTAGATSAAPNYIMTLYLVDLTWGGFILEEARVRDGISPREYEVTFNGLTPDHEYIIYMYVENNQANPRMWFYREFLEVVEF